MNSLELEVKPIAIMALGQFVALLLHDTFDLPCLLVCSISDQRSDGTINEYNFSPIFVFNAAQFPNPILSTVDGVPRQQLRKTQVALKEYCSSSLAI